MSTTGRKRPDHVSQALASSRLGVPAVVFFVLSAAAPLTVVGGVITTGYAVTGITGLPLAFLAVAAVLVLFSVGYVAMARHVSNAGAFYTYVTRGLGRPAGIGAAWVALLAYNMMQVGLYGGFGFVAAPLLNDWFGVSLAWWVIALFSWALVAVLGVMRVDINGTILAFLLVAEIAVIVVYDAASLLNPAGNTVSYETLKPSNLFVSGLGALLVIAVTGFVGFEGAAVFAEETKNPRRTVPIATYVSVGIIATLYAVSAWAMTVATGPENIVNTSRENGPETIFLLAGAHLGTTAVHIGHALLLTSLIAAMISFHNTTARYAFALGRERVLPAAFGRTSRRSGAPKVGSLAQSALGLVVILGYAAAGLDPLTQLFFWAGTSGAFGVLLLITATSVAVIGFFSREPNGESAWRRLIAPGLAVLALSMMVVLSVSNFATLLGVEATSPLRWIVPALFPVAALIGVGWALVLKATRPDVYRSIGLGANSSIGRTGPSVLAPEAPVSPRVATEGAR
ncbi:amino acid permease [Longispora fulva]|uniref:Amino acid transporter n=1 Tax=Longispora fulva TaxID=619741 RepID=A0A8J7GQW3_9ACTN|nr:APC family permease [Longispora fulva]MBG6141683.1 amino acid transporter [Longispora fulva]GIG59162.1 amino acid permease [Longispora fulva]